MYTTSSIITHGKKNFGHSPDDRHARPSDGSNAATQLHRWALKYQKRKLYFWEKMQRLFLEYRIRDFGPSISPCRGK